MIGDPFRRAASAASCAAAVCACAASAAADDTRLSLVFLGSAAATSLDNASISVAASGTEPDPLKGRNLRLDGSGAMGGGGYKIVIDSHRWQGGLGINVFGASGYRLRYQPLASGLDVGTGQLWGMTIDMFFGRHWRLGPVIPYAELRLAFSLLQAEVKLRSDAYGTLGATPYSALSVGVGPRVGVMVPISRLWFIDASVYGSFVGMEKVAGWIGIGVSTGGPVQPPPKRRRRVVAPSW
jgi:hypothetical protein